jgi:SAM-dependent methyltransferase
MRIRRRCADLTARVESLEARAHAAEAELARATLLVNQFRTLAFVSDALPLETFDHPDAGRVLGYRDQPAEIPPGEAYAYFTDVFRGDAERVRDLQRRYLPLIGSRQPVLDVGCGRGELLGLLRDAGLEHAGVDADPAMVERCRRAGHAHVTAGDATDHLVGLADDSLGAIVACQVIEHMPPGDLTRFLRLARRKLGGDGILIAETVNPYAVPSFRAFWVDPTHRQPLFPETLLALCRIEGFRSAFVFHPEVADDVETDRFIAGAYTVVAGG